jgi:Family of unknown function (DUF5361)
VLGLRLDWLGSEALSWRDLLVIFRMAEPPSRIFSAVHGDDAQWGLPEQLLASMADDLSWLVWAKTEDGQKNRNRPDRIPRPGVKPNKDRKQIGSAPLPIDQMAEWLGWTTTDEETKSG